MMSIHWFTMLKVYGENIFDQFVTTLYDLGHQFGKLIREEANFELAVQPVSNIVCFRYVSDKLDLTRCNSINKEIRLRLLEDGEFYIVQTKLREIHYLRTTVMNPFTNIEHLKSLLKKIEKIAEALVRN